MCNQDPIKEKSNAFFLSRKPKDIKSDLRKETYQISRIAFACVRTHTFTVTRTVVQVVAVKLWTVLSSPTGIAKTYGTYAISIMETAVWAVDNYQERMRFLTCQWTPGTKSGKTLNTPNILKVVLNTINANHLAKSPGNFGWKTNGTLILRKLRTSYVWRLFVHSIWDKPAENPIQFLYSSHFQSSIMENTVTGSRRHIEKEKKFSNKEKHLQNGHPNRFFPEHGKHSMTMPKDSFFRRSFDIRYNKIP